MGAGPGFRLLAISPGSRSCIAGWCGGPLSGAGRPDHHRRAGGGGGCLPAAGRAAAAFCRICLHSRMPRSPRSLPSLHPSTGARPTKLLDPLGFSAATEVRSQGGVGAAATLKCPQLHDPATVTVARLQSPAATDCPALADAQRYTASTLRTAKGEGSIPTWRTLRAEQTHLLGAPQH